MSSSPIHPAYPLEPKTGHGCVAASVYAVCFVSGMTVLYAFFLDPFRNAIAASGWTPTPCTVFYSKVETVTDKEKKNDKGGATIVGYRPEIKYAYRVAGRPNRSERIWFIRPSPDTQADAKKVVDKYPQGSEQQCFVDPKNEDFAVLERGFRPQMLIALFPLAFAIFGMFGMVSRLLRRVSTPDPRFAPMHHYQPGATLTHRAQSGVLAFLLIVLFAVVWNSTISFMLREVVKTWREGIPGCWGWFFTIFVIPFALIGVLLLVLSVYFFLKLFNPRPSLRLSTAEIPAGGSAELTWRFWGRYDRVHRLRISLEGREEATYQSSDETATAREVFATVGLIDTTKPQEIRWGKVKFAVPENAMPTFSAPHNRIAWAIRVCGEIRRWPDVDEEFEFNVLPAAVSEPAGAAAS
jgi:Protein of unknown function (DUF3592)